MNAKGGDGKTPWFVVRRLEGREGDSDVREGRKKWLEATGGSARLVEVDVDDTGPLVRLFPAHIPRSNPG